MRGSRRSKEDIIEHEAELNLLAIQQRKASDKELPAVLRRREVIGANIERDRIALDEETNRSAALWKTIRDGEAEARRAAALAAPEKLRVETLWAIADYRSGLAQLAPQATAIANGVAGLRRIIDSAPFNSFPIPPQALAAQMALREVHEVLRSLRESFEAILR